MGKENLEKISSEKLLTAPEVIFKLLKKHPEIIQVSIAEYFLRPHGEKDLGDSRLFASAFDLSKEIFENSSYSNEMIALGSIVDICPVKNCKHKTWHHFIGDSIMWQFDHDECFRPPQGPQRSFIFLDIEMKEPEVLGTISEVLKNFKEDWYVLHSGGGFHVIIDKLVKLEDLPEEYGKIISLFGNEVGSQSLKNWGESLEKVGKNWQKVLEWGELVREKIGHIDEPIHEQGKEVHMIDLRHIAHSLKKTYEYHDFLKEVNYKPGYGRYHKDPGKIGGFYLRTSAKPDKNYPFLVAQKENGKIQFFQTVNDLLRSQKQQRLF